MSKKVILRKYLGCPKCSQSLMPSLLPAPPVYIPTFSDGAIGHRKILSLACPSCGKEIFPPDMSEEQYNELLCKEGRFYQIADEDNDTY